PLLGYDGLDGIEHALLERRRSAGCDLDEYASGQPYAKKRAVDRVRVYRIGHALRELAELPEVFDHADDPNLGARAAVMVDVLADRADARPECPLDERPIDEDRHIGPAFVFRPEPAPLEQTNAERREALCRRLVHRRHDQARRIRAVLRRPRAR